MTHRNPRGPARWRVPIALLLLGSTLALPSMGQAADTQAPSRPSNLTATAVSSSQINLSWSASTDKVGVTGYRVYRCTGSSNCTPTSQIATTTTTSYNDTGRSANTLYRYRVRAQDAAGNLSSYSSTRSATTLAPDTQAPTTPSNLTATAVSSSQINLSWSASTDNVGVTGYRVYRCTGSSDCTPTSQIATATTNSYSDTGRSASTTYRYRVRAEDAAGNLSSYSSTRSATTPSGGTPQPSISINDVTVTEGGTANFTVSLSAAFTQQVTVVASTANGTATAGSDYTARSNVTLTFPAGTTTQAFAVTTINDTSVESTETFSVTLSGATNATIADGTGVGTITDNDTAAKPTLSIGNRSQAEGNSGTSTMTFTVSLSAAAPTGGVTFNFATANGTATAGTTGSADYVAASGSRTIAAGATTATIPVTIRGDTTEEPNETFTVNITGATNTANTSASATGTITNDDQAVAQCNPAVDGDHRNCIIGEYTGPEVCVACHETEARNMHSSVHYQQNGPTDFVTNITGNAGEGPAGKPSGVSAVIGINSYCGTHENSPRFTCAGCHVGNGRFPKTPTELTALGQVSAVLEREELANIDCLMCHQETYKRFPDWVLPADGGESYGFTDLVLENVCLDNTGELADPLALKPGRFCADPSSPPYFVTRTGLAGIPNVDTDTYDPITGIKGTFDFRFRPAGAPGSEVPFPLGAPLPGGPMALTTEQAAQQVHSTTRQSCLNCHAGAAGANGAKRGDLSTANIASTDLTLDRHMAANGSNMTCSQCHNVDDTPTVNDTGRPTTHRVRGRGLDLRANDHATRFTCDNAGCHNASTVHNNVSSSGLLTATRLTRHTSKVACQTCHIPRYGKGVATEIARDWQEPHVTQTACNGRGGWLPRELKGGQGAPAEDTPDPANGAYQQPLVPTYQWFDGTSQVYYLTETLANTPRKPLPDTMVAALNMAPGTQAYVMGRPNPNPENATTRVSGASLAAAKIYPMKEHWGKLARNVSVKNPKVPLDSLIPQSTFEFFRTGSFCRSVAEGLGQNPDVVCPDPQDQRAPAGTEVVAVHTYQTLNHGVEPQANSLGVNSTCGVCHSVNGMAGGPARMDLKGQLGYRVRSTIGWTVNSSGESTCANSCHGSKKASFVSFHEKDKHVSRGCNACHDQITGR